MIKFAFGAALVAVAMGCSAIATPSHAGVITHEPNCTRGIIGCLHVKVPPPKCTRGIIGCLHVKLPEPKCTRGIIGCLHVKLEKPKCTRGIIGCRR